MAPDELTQTHSAFDPDIETALGTDDVELDALTSIAAGDVTANMSAMGSARVVGDLRATASAVGVASVTGDVAADLSVVGIASSHGDATVTQSYAGMVAAGGDLTASQTIAPVAVARTISFEQGAAGVIMGGDVNVRRGLVGVVLAPGAQISEDSRVLLTGRSLGVMALAVLGGFGLVGLGVWLAGKHLSAVSQTDLRPHHWWNRLG